MLPIKSTQKGGKGGQWRLPQGPGWRVANGKACIYCPVLFLQKFGTGGATSGLWHYGKSGQNIHESGVGGDRRISTLIGETGAGACRVVRSHGEGFTKPTCPAFTYEKGGKGVASKNGRDGHRCAER